MLPIDIIGGMLLLGEFLIPAFISRLFPIERVLSFVVVLFIVSTSTYLVLILIFGTSVKRPVCFLPIAGRSLRLILLALSIMIDLVVL